MEHHKIRSRGVLFVATKNENYLEEAYQSARTIKGFFPDLSITLFTDRPESGFCNSKYFDNIFPVSSCERAGIPWSQGQLMRIRCLNKSPYDFTVHLDTDTRVLSPQFIDAFEYLKESEIALVECTQMTSYCRSRYGRRMFNVGFIAYKKCPSVMMLFEQWEKDSE